MFGVRALDILPKELQLELLVHPFFLDLLSLLSEDALRKYPVISREQMESDLAKTRENQAHFEQENRQN